MAMLPNAEKEKGRQKEIPFCQPSLPTDKKSVRRVSPLKTFSFMSF
jgi:hypothetical protein